MANACEMVGEMAVLVVDVGIEMDGELKGLLSEQDEDIG